MAELEAQCNYLSVITTPHSGIAAVLMEGKTDFLCDEGNEDAMAANIDGMLPMSDARVGTIGQAIT